MQAFLFLTALAAASAVDCRKRTIPDFLCLLTAAAGLISFSPAQFFGVLAALPLLIAALIRPECMGGGDIKLTAAAGFVLGFWRGIWGMALGLLLAVLYFCTATLMDLVTEAFPIVVFAKQLEDKSRKIMEIMECEILPTGERRYNTLYHFKIEENRLEDGKYRIKGRHEAVNPISESLQKRFIDNGMPQEVLTQLVGKKSAPSKGKSGSSPAKAGQATPAPKTRSAQSKPPAKPETGKEGGESV